MGEREGGREETTREEGGREGGRSREKNADSAIFKRRDVELCRCLEEQETILKRLRKRFKLLHWSVR